MTEQKEPYYSSRVHITEPTAAKVLGIKTRSIEVTFGNHDSVTIRNKKDIAEIIDNIDIAKKVWDLWEQVTAKGKADGHKFVEDIE